ncbi:MAG TPA: tetratricopeptide repeat protein [Anaerolineales bacterium]|nr:tetratricopeptide repeat protein [Anaerolineales bacterium]
MSDSNSTINSSPAPRVGDTQPLKPLKQAPRWRTVLLSILGVLALLAIGVLGGYGSGVAQRRSAQRQVISGQLLEQYQYALVDEQFGRYEAARQRLEFIIQNQPSFPGAQDELTKVMVLSTIPTPSPTPPPTPTPDMRGVETLYESARQLIAAGDWANAITTLDQLRKQAPALNTAQVDGMYYFALRNYGVNLIQKQGDLEGGIYQLTLAERFAPIDSTAAALREGARAYIQAASYFGINWASAVELFRSVPPGIWDGNMTAQQRLRIALMRHAEELWAAGDACGASELFQEAQGIAELDAAAAKIANQAFQQCYPATEIPTVAATAETPAAPPTVESPPTP